MLQQPLGHTWASATDALRDALTLEASVTRKIKDIAVECEKTFTKKNETSGITEMSENDYHVSSILIYECFIMHFLIYFKQSEWMNVNLKCFI